jgi:DNA-binding transcriptional MerR regulator
VTVPGRSGHRSGVSIGTVLAQLRADFPDITISKIRFLESEGLIQPQRSAAGYRQFSSTDVERLRYVLAAQRDHYLPLRVIKEHLDAHDRAEFTTPEPVGSENPAAAADPAWRTEEQLLAAAGIGKAALTELEQFGLVRPGPAGFYDTDAVLVARTARAMTDFGLEPRHLRAFRASADREVGLLAQIVTPVTRQRDPDARARADEVVRELAVLSLRLHAVLVKIGLRGVIGT